MEVETLHRFTLRPTRPDERLGGCFFSLEGWCEREKNGKFKIIDAKFTTKSAADFVVKNSLTKNQRKAFKWLEEGQNIVVKVTANAGKLGDLGISTGSNIVISGIRVLRSKADDVLDSNFLTYF